MRYILLACLLALALAFELGVLIATSDDSFGSFDPYHPATLFPIVASQIQDLQSRVRVRVTEFVDAVIAPYRTQIRHGSADQSEPQEM
jgi:hypothetical protein